MLVKMIRDSVSMLNLKTSITDILTTPSLYTRCNQYWVILGYGAIKSKFIYTHSCVIGAYIPESPF